MNLEPMKTLLEAQTGVINQQTEVIQNLEAMVQELRVLVLETRESMYVVALRRTQPQVFPTLGTS